MESDESSDYSDIPKFALDSGATCSYGSRQTPLDTSKSTNRKIGGIGGVIIHADREGRCKAIPNVALSDGIRRNLASVSQLTKHYQNLLAFDGKYAYAVPPKHLPVHGADIVGAMTSNKWLVQS